MLTMTAILARKIGTFPTGSPEWHAARAGKMSGSRIAAAAGLSPFESPFSLWHRMAGNIGEPEVTLPMLFGTLMEPVIIDYFADQHPEIHVMRKPGTWLNIARPWMLANPDALLRIESKRRADAVLEVKTARYGDEWGEEGTDQIPVHYLAQVLWYLHTLGLRYCMVIVLIAGSEPREYLVEADPSAAEELCSIAREFLDRLEAGIMPEIDGHTATLEAIKELHPEIEQTSVDIPDELGVRLVRTKSRLIVPTAEFNAAKAELAAFMGQAHLAFWNGRKVADRRAKGITGTPYVQLASLPAPTRVPDNREAVAV